MSEPLTTDEKARLRQECESGAWGRSSQQVNDTLLRLLAEIDAMQAERDQARALAEQLNGEKHDGLGYFEPVPWDTNDNGAIDDAGELAAYAEASDLAGLAAREAQPEPLPNDSRPIWQLVVEDMHARDQLGRERYGTPLQAHNGRDALQDAYEEALDLSAYLRQAIEERDDE